MKIVRVTMYQQGEIKWDKLNDNEMIRTGALWDVGWVTMYQQGDDRVGRSVWVGSLTDVGPGVPRLDV